MNPRLAIVIPTWNRKELLTACLASLEAQTFQDFEVIVVDDGSTDGTAGLIELEYPTVRLVRLTRNRGFCVATNAGIRAALGLPPDPKAQGKDKGLQAQRKDKGLQAQRKDKGLQAQRKDKGLQPLASRPEFEFVMLLNNDMTLEADCLGHLIATAGFDDAAMFAPLVLWLDDPSTVYGAGDRQHANGRPESIGFRCARDGFAFPDTIFGVPAGAGLYRRAVFERVGLLDERFVAYFEDSDLNFRARLAGLRAACVPDAVAHHVGSASIEGRAWWRARQCYRNHALLLLKNMPTELMRENAPAIRAERRHQLRSAFSAARAEFGAGRAAWEVLSSWLSTLRHVPHALAARREIQRGRAISAAELAALLSDSSAEP